MIKKNIFGILLCVFCFQFLFAQTEKDSLFLKVNLKYGNHSLELNKKYISKNDTLEISLIKFYLSGIEIEYNNKTTFIKKNSYHLIDGEKHETLKIPICKKNNLAISKIKFNIGIDSLASVSGANAGDLDLQNGMYWAWQSGYINMKIEGKSNSCKTRKNKFQFHVGGYLKPNYALRKINFSGNIHDNINLAVDLSQIFDFISLQQNNSIMIPGQDAMQLADLSKNIFRLE